MVQNLLHAVTNGLLYIKRHPQVTLTFILIIIVPIAFLFNGQQFLSVAKNNQEYLEQDRIGLLHDVFVSYIKIVRYDPIEIQKEINSIVSQNADIVRFHIVQEDKGEFKIVAAYPEDDVGVTLEDHTKYNLALIDPSRTFLSPYAENGIRYWQSYRYVKGDDSTAYYIFTQSSLENVDTLLSIGIKHAYAWLVGILIILLILLRRHIKLIDYAYLYRETKQANEMKDMFTNMIAHELRAPLTAMKGYASMVHEDTNAPQNIKEYGRKIEDSAERLVVIISDLLDVARIQSGKLLIKPEKIKIQEVVSSVLDIMQKPALDKNIVLKQENIVHGLTITIDPKRLHQALTNLVSNSIKYTESGSITVAVEERDDRIEIRVKDTGTGISAENQKNLFTPFFRVASSSVDTTVGTGLGMWITKQLIELMHGSIGVESIKNVGTHIVITLPK